MSDLRQRTEDTGSGSLRTRTARGSLLNGAFLVVMIGVGALEGLVIARFVTPREYAVWGILLSAVALVWWLKNVGVSDKFIQQSDLDQEDAFARAFGTNLLVLGVCFLLMLVAIPLLALVYSRSELLLPGLALSLIVPAYALQFPMVVFQRRMQWGTQRTLQSIEPLVGLAVTVVLVAAGLNYWGMVIGALVGAWACAVASMVLCPFPVRVRLVRSSLREYLSFSWPVVVYSGSSIVVAQAVLLSGAHSLGLAGAGAIYFAATIAQFTDRADAVVTQTLYPAICAVQDRAELLRESFETSNRLTLMWGLPFGVGLTLFAPDLVHFVLGRKWDDAVPLLQALGLIAASHHIAFNWDAFYRARGDSRPLAWAGAYVIAVTLLVTVPLILVLGFPGFVIGSAVGQIGYLVFRAWLLKRLLPGLNFVRHVARALAPTVPAALLIGLARLVEPAHRTGWIAAIEVGLYVATTVLATVLLERKLLREIHGYVTRRASGTLVPS